MTRLRAQIDDLADSTLLVGKTWGAALRDRAMSPTRWLAPLVQRAARVPTPPVNSSPHRVVYTRGSMRLLHFEPTQRRHATPILFVYSLINRYYILDFLPGRSLIEFMRDQGFDVYAIDWGTPGELEEQLTWDELPAELTAEELAAAGASAESVAQAAGLAGSCGLPDRGSRPWRTSSAVSTTITPSPAHSERAFSPSRVDHAGPPVLRSRAWTLPSASTAMKRSWAMPRRL